MGLGLFSLLMRLRGKLYETRLLHMFAMVMGPRGLHRRAGRVDHHRDRTAAVHGLRFAAHR